MSEGIQQDWAANKEAARRTYLKATGQQTCTVAGVDLKDLPQEECEKAITAAKNGWTWTIVNGKVLANDGSEAAVSMFKYLKEKGASVYDSMTKK